MSFFALSPRNIDSSFKNKPQIGPGAYDSLYNSKKSQSKAYAPFGSVQKKKSLLENQNTIGPGLYQVSGQICKPSITKYENPNSIIIKINEQGWSQFKSKTNRFKQTVNPTQITPGPGQYNYQRTRPKSQSKDLLRSSIGDKIKEINVKNYIERRKPTLITDPVKIQTEQQPQKTINKGLSWSLNKKQRFSPLIKQPFQEQHKAHFIDKIRDERRKKQRSKSQSAVFVSKSLKSHIETEIYHTSNPFKVELRKMIDYKDERPGPGSYNYEEMDERKKIKISKHQFFGSTVERFKTQSSLPQNLGPGYYTPKVNSINKNNIQQNKHDQAQLNRHSYIPTNGSQLGPGAYSLDKQKKHRAACKWVFGSKKPRFSQESTIQYNQLELDQNQMLRKMKRQKEFQYRKEFLNSGNHANFASTSKRFQDPIKKFQNIPVGHYDVTQTDIASKVKKASLSTEKQHGRTNYHGISAPFMSTVDRFRPNQQDEPNHSHHDCWCLVKSVQKQVYEHQSSVFSSKQKRTVVFQSKSRVYAPPVGSYNQESSFVRNSFNSRFLKTNESKTKKLKIWNAHKSKHMDKKPSLSFRQQQISMIKIN